MSSVIFNLINDKVILKNFQATRRIIKFGDEIKRNESNIIFERRRNGLLN